MYGIYNFFINVCECNVGFIGRDCSVVCGVCLVEIGICFFIATLEVSWNVAIKEYILKEL